MEISPRERLVEILEEAKAKLDEGGFAPVSECEGELESLVQDSYNKGLGAEPGELLQLIDRVSRKLEECNRAKRDLERTTASELLDSVVASWSHQSCSAPEEAGRIRRCRARAIALLAGDRTRADFVSDLQEALADLDKEVRNAPPPVSLRPEALLYWIQRSEAALVRQRKSGDSPKTAPVERLLPGARQLADGHGSGESLVGMVRELAAATLELEVDLHRETIESHLRDEQLLLRVIDLVPRPELRSTERAILRSELAKLGQFPHEEWAGQQARRLNDWLDWVEELLEDRLEEERFRAEDIAAVAREAGLAEVEPDPTPDSGSYRLWAARLEGQLADARLAEIEESIENTVTRAWRRIRIPEQDSDAVRELREKVTDVKIRLAGEPVESITEAVDALSALLPEEGAVEEPAAAIPTLSEGEIDALQRAHPLAGHAWERLQQAAERGSTEAVEILEQLAEEADAIAKAWRRGGGRPYSSGT